MVKRTTNRIRRFFERRFPERHVFVRTPDGEITGRVLTPRKQLLLVCGAALLGAWCLLTTAGSVWGAVTSFTAERDVHRARASAERMNADLQARLDSAVARMTATSGSIDDLAHTVERRHAALTQVMTLFRGVDGAEQALEPTVSQDPDQSPVARLVSVQMDQERLITRAQTFADSRAERLRLAFRLAGLNPSAYAGSPDSLGGPLVEADDPEALATILDVDEAFATRIQAAADDLSEMRSLANTAERLPLARPATGVRQTSSFGVRFDPFSGRPAVHRGQDFAGPYMTPIRATAPGVVSFAGVRNGYGNTVEIDHGGGFKTRYAHLQGFNVTVGQRVAIGQRIGAMGSTGRSTGVHLHYEVWVDGRPQNPARFMRAGEYVQQAQE
jgi:murein DD-endopeptidase MepM/ murein hydrolase activator NlpD